MKNLLLFTSALLVGLPSPHRAAAASTAFSYQVRVTENGTPANTTYDLTFQLFDSPTNGSQIGSTLTNSAVTASNGLVTLLLDFGASAFPGADRWLQVGARTNGTSDPFALFTPRQPLTPTPYALY